MTGRAKIKTALAMVISKVEAPVLVVRGIMMRVRMMSVMESVVPLSIKLIVCTAMITRVELAGYSVWPSIGFPPKYKKG